MWAWLNRREVVIRAQLIHQVEQITWWRRRNDLPQTEPDQSPEAQPVGPGFIRNARRRAGTGADLHCRELCTARDHLLLRLPRRPCSERDRSRRRGPAGSGNVPANFLDRFRVLSGRGSLELFAKLPSRLKLLAETLFTQTILDFELGEWRPNASYELNGLMGGEFSLATDPEDGVTVHIRQLRLSMKNSHRQITLKPDPDWPGDIFHMLDEVLDKERVPLSSVNVTLVTFCFEFAAHDGRRAGSVTFDVAYPYSCGLRNQPADRIEMVMKYLRVWGIYATRPADDDTAAA